MRKIVEFLVKSIIAVLLISYLFYKIGVQQIIGILPGMNLFYFALFWISFFASLFLGVINIKILLKGIGYNLPTKKVAKYYTTSWSIGLYAPGKLGEFSLVYLLRREKIGMGQSMAISVIDKVITFIVFGTVSVVGFITFFTIGQSFTLMVILSSALAITTVMLLSEFSRSLIKRYILRKLAPKFSGFNSTMRLILGKINLLIYNFILTTIKLGLMGLSIHLLFLTFGTKVSFVYTLLIVAIGTIIALIPITFSGLGVREAASVYLFSKLGVNPAVTLTVFLLAVITNYIISAIFFIVIIKRMRLYEEMSEAKEIFR